MILAFKLSDLVTVPFGYLLSFLYQLTSNYGIIWNVFGHDTSRSNNNIITNSYTW